MHAHTTVARTHARSREHAFTVVELMIALLVISILIIVASRSFGGATSATRANEAKATGSAYLQAVAQYQSDHANRNPVTPSGNNTTAVQRGPLNLLNRPYLPSTPEAVSGGRVGVSVSAMGGGNCAAGTTAPAGAGTQSGWVSVCLGADPQYGVRVSTRTKPTSSWTDASAKVCWLGIGPAGAPRC